MIPRNTMDVETVQSNFDGETIDMTIDENSLSHIMSVLTDLYSDTMLAVIREYSTNARDAHIDAGKADVPIEISTPSPLNPVFKVKDFGIGLSLDDIRNVYSKYGASTKRGSDTVNGMLGLGAKAALTYTSSFTIVAVKDGVKNIVSVGRNEEGSGYMEIVHTSPSTEDNGVEIQVPVPKDDGFNFRQKIEDFFRYWEKGTVRIDSRDTVGLDYSNLTKVNDRTYLFNSYGDNLIVMGGVTYPSPFSNDFSGFTKYIYFADMGDVVFSPSRESLLTNKKNRDVCDSIVDSIKKSVLSSAQAEIDKAGSEVEAVKVAQERIDKSVRPVLNRIMSPYEFDYKGKPLEEFREELIEAINDEGNTMSIDIPNPGSQSSVAELSTLNKDYFSAARLFMVINAKVIVEGVDPDVVNSSNRRSLFLRGMRELGYTHHRAVTVKDASNLSKVLGDVKVISFDSVKEASREVLRRNRKAPSPGKKKPTYNDDLLAVINSIDNDAIMDVESKSVSGKGENVVYLARTDVRTSTGYVSGYSSFERAKKFRSIMVHHPDVTFVAVTDSEKSKFLKRRPKATHLPNFIKSISKEGFVDRMVKASGGALTKEDVYSWKGLTGNYNPGYNTERMIRYLAGSDDVNSPLFDEAKEYTDKQEIAEKAYTKASLSIGNTHNAYEFTEYCRAKAAGIRTKENIVTDILRKYPIVDAIANFDHGTMKHLIQYIKAVDSGVIV